MMDFKLMRKNEVDGGFTLLFSGRVSSDDIEALELKLVERKALNTLMEHGGGFEAAAKRLMSLSVLFGKAASMLEDDEQSMLAAKAVIARVKHGLR